ncbi:hypothetical protein [Thalassolituus sp.]|jgi:hypothetical protein|uniref:hypothetical protein n=1 Tax=Thalassolituus sp. TaxID=2030822 RepID=UPI0032D917D4
MTIGILIALAIILAITIAAWIILNKTNKKSTTASTDKQNAETTDPKKARTDLVVETLLKLNIDIRISGITEKTMLACEDIIDSLINLLPRIEEQDTLDGELSWTVRRIASEYLPNKCVYPYIRLSQAQRDSEENISSLNQSLSKLKTEITNIDELIAKKDVQSFKSKAEFLNQRFMTDGEA